MSRSRRLALAALVAVQVGAIERGRPLERGANLVEYALLLALVVIVCIGAVRAFGAKVPSGFSSATTSL